MPGEAAPKSTPKTTEERLDALEAGFRDLVSETVANKAELVRVIGLAEAAAQGSLDALANVRTVLSLSKQ